MTQEPLAKMLRKQVEAILSCNRKTHIIQNAARERIV